MNNPLQNIKHDDRKACLGWAPGDYFNRCHKCEAHFVGDKRAVSCADCAYEQIAKFTPEFAANLVATCNSILYMLGNVDHSIGNGEHSAKLRGDKLNDIRTILNQALEQIK